MEPIFERAVIVGAGLLGASLGLALRASGAADRITGVGRRQSTLDTALAIGAIHDTSLDLKQAAVEADCIVVATPANTVIDALDALHAACKPSAVILDVASTKAAICAHAEQLWKLPRRFIGCHPMAGSEKSGPEHASADLYRNSVCFVEESPDIDPEAASLVGRLWECAGARVVAVDPSRHDALLARTSHMPHIVATMLAKAAQREGATRDFTGNGFRDMTRLADGSPEMWRDITLTNRDEILAAVRAMQFELELLGQVLVDEDPGALYEFFEAGRIARREVYSE